MSESEFVLKTTPPRLPRTALLRERLLQAGDRVFDATATAVVAPAGFGKTTLLLQWRCRWLEQGARVAWVSADAADDPIRFAALLAHALLAIGAIGGEDVAGRTGMDALTAILAGVARRRVRIVLVLDDCERLPEATVAQPLQYLLLNAPDHLNLALGSRMALPLRTAELMARERVRVLPVQELCLKPQESLAILQQRFGERLHPDACLRLHDAAEGWPIGLQLAITAIEQEPDPAAAARALTARRGTLQDYFADSMRAAFSGERMTALTRIAILDRFNAELAALACGAPVAELLEQLLHETPILIAGEHAGWFRLHPLARDYLLGLFECLPAAEREQLHARVSHWYSEQGHFHEAAAHALAAGDEALAQAHAARSLWALGARGRLDEAREWLARMPEVLHSPDLHVRLSAATVLAFSERNAEGLRLAREVLADPALPLPLEVVALRVASSAAAYADHAGLLQDQLAHWPEVPEGTTDPLYRVNRLNVEAFLALQAGETARVRALAETVAGLEEQGSLLLALAINRMLVGMSHLCDGDPRRVLELLRAPLQAAERTQGRRSMIACLYASILAQAQVALGQPHAAQLLLADRLDMIERAGFPDNILAAYTALAETASARGDTAAALGALEGLDAIARRRRLPRLRLHVLAKRIQLLAPKGYREIVAGLLAAVDALAVKFAQPMLRPYLPEYTLTAALAHAHAAIAEDAGADAEHWLEIAAVQAAAANRYGDTRTIELLRAGLGRKQDGDAMQALSLETATSVVGREGAAAGPPAREKVAAAVLPISGMRRHGGVNEVSELLTPKEAEILGLLGRGMSNKRIALTLGIGPETVKWHVKNLFSKLSVGSREHAVGRARLLGLMEA